MKVLLKDIIKQEEVDGGLYLTVHPRVLIVVMEQFLQSSNESDKLMAKHFMFYDTITLSGLELAGFNRLYGITQGWNREVKLVCSRPSNHRALGVWAKLHYN